MKKFETDKFFQFVAAIVIVFLISLFDKSQSNLESAILTMFIYLGCRLDTIETYLKAQSDPKKEEE